MKQRGMTLIELMILLSIGAIIVCLALPALVNVPAPAPVAVVKHQETSMLSFGELLGLIVFGIAAFVTGILVWLKILHKDITEMYVDRWSGKPSPNRVLNGGFDNCTRIPTDGDKHEH